jgi:hypothetical protein
MLCVCPAYCYVYTPPTHTHNDRPSLAHSSTRTAAVASNLVHQYESTCVEMRTRLKKPMRTIDTVFPTADPRGAEAGCTT